MTDTPFYGKRLEPRGRRIIHGAGQSPDAFAEYYRLLTAAPPLIYMNYAGLRATTPEVLDRLTGILEGYETYLVPQIGLAMTHDGSPEQHYEGDVAEGRHDAQIEAFCQALKRLGRPVYLRIGYEFNGRQWNGYQPETFRAAWVRVADAIRAHDLRDVATVWCYAPDGDDKDWMAYYPGDAYVDWWSIDLFSAEHLWAEDSHAFVRDAGRRGFPVMIGESTPRYTGAQDGPASWCRWYAPYFGFMRAYPQVKAFCYISWDWAQYPKWADWGDGRIGANETVLDLYREEMLDARYLHGGTEAQVREALGM